MLLPCTFFLLLFFKIYPFVFKFAALESIPRKYVYFLWRQQNSRNWLGDRSVENWKRYM